MAIGLVGALVCILTQKSDDLASDAFTGNMLCLLSSVAYAVYLVMSQRILGKRGSDDDVALYIYGSRHYRFDCYGYHRF